eukprot:13357257-Alexandrium_andersonii.AAC.1
MVSHDLEMRRALQLRSREPHRHLAQPRGVAEQERALGALCPIGPLPKEDPLHLQEFSSGRKTRVGNHAGADWLLYDLGR